MESKINTYEIRGFPQCYGEAWCKGYVFTLLINFWILSIIWNILELDEISKACKERFFRNVTCYVYIGVENTKSFTCFQTICTLTTTFLNNRALHTDRTSLLVSKYIYFVDSKKQFEGWKTHLSKPLQALNNLSFSARAGPYPCVFQVSWGWGSLRTVICHKENQYCWIVVLLYKTKPLLFFWFLFFFERYSFEINFPR